MDEELRNALLRLVRFKFASYPNVAVLADDIVNDAYVKLRTSKAYAAEKVNYGYLSVVCVRLAYRKFMAQGVDFSQMYFDAEGTSLVDETDIAREIIAAEDAAAVLESLKVLRDIERIVITQRYYGELSFAEIAASNGLKLNTVLSHHRRALGKLRPQLTKLLSYRKEDYDE
ncbi:MAG: sigma-70 family RNA polymerase sigma factor [Defluviitaleaceae bacterium]|nr:sigma-70 family RNA polymerase sigma factor [Defluviitaleaceae bacterium]MCL2275912.1 sigma-70 family RNA polymerase sigma factor [Defluviitaleaceae bacterium]